MFSEKLGYSVPGGVNLLGTARTYARDSEECPFDRSTWREDGRVCHESGKTLPSSLLKGHSEQATRIVAKVEAALKSRAANKDPANWFNLDCQLSLTATGPFQDIAKPTYVAATEGVEKEQSKPARLSWLIRRTGRVRMPYATALLGQFLAIQGREAFELDYLK